ncbi:MAG: hypothetical protein HOG79_17920 [Prolixibacteraceae bacterium]|jgi:hypothetical protein|nr:hypothetical protein [Deltaproteobacteria bacterium]MBT4643050.1 hypothetical protein [Deltaproteobacteria bacterium]MBT6007599.1 hypothetical protein [Prolixibacteraceae bacterium]MBT7038347.1 hypothetical protein [Bacteroidota bacterium]
MSETVILKNPDSSETIEIEKGFKWMILIFGWTFFPLKKIGLPEYGIILLVMTIVSVGLTFAFPDNQLLDKITQGFTSAATIGQIYFAIKGANFAIKKYEKKGWQIQ